MSAEIVQLELRGVTIVWVVALTPSMLKPIHRLLANSRLLQILTYLMSYQTIFQESNIHVFKLPSDFFSIII